MYLNTLKRLFQSIDRNNGSVLACSKRSCSSSTRGLDVAVIGAPNVGKSLLTNQLVRAAVSSVSSKMDTTTQNVSAILTEDDVQLILLDSPGTVGQRHARETMMQNHSKILTEPEKALQKAEHILVVQDATATGDYIHHRVLHLLHRYSHLASSLVINKIDMTPRRSDLLALTRILTNGRVAGAPIKVVEKAIGRLGVSSKVLVLHGDSIKLQDDIWQERFRSVIARPSYQVGFGETKRLFADVRGFSNFSAVFFVSALTGEGIETLRQHLKDLSLKKVWRQGKMAVTTKSSQQICLDSVRAALLDTVPSNIAYCLKPKISEWNEDGDVLKIIVEIPCEKDRIGRLVLGKVCCCFHFLHSVEHNHIILRSGRRVVFNFKGCPTLSVQLTQLRNVQIYRFSVHCISLLLILSLQQYPNAISRALKCLGIGMRVTATATARNGTVKELIWSGR